MAKSADIPGSRDRSPSYPVIPLEEALNRLEAFEAHFKRAPARPDNVGSAWGIKTKARADRVVAALRYYGLVQYHGAGEARQVAISKEGHKYLRAQQEEIKCEVVRAAALRPPQIAKFWDIWGPGDRPADEACLDALVLDNGFSTAGARKFLKVYDGTIAFASLSDSDKDDQTTDGADASSAMDIPVSDEEAAHMQAEAEKPLPTPLEAGVVEATLPLGEGRFASFKWPEHLSADSYEDLQSWVGLLLRRAKRSVPVQQIDEGKRAILGGLGYSEDDINSLTFWQAQDILDRNVRKPKGD